MILSRPGSDRFIAPPGRTGFPRYWAATMANATETWDSYAWPNATTKKIAKKKTYWLKVGDVFIGAGIYE